MCTGPSYVPSFPEEPPPIPTILPGAEFLLTPFTDPHGAGETHQPTRYNAAIRRATSSTFARELKALIRK
ncbi:MAG: hypothetical protein RLZZ399_977 [Verrucomicrobiota bacterium]|jgi:hypothetical protein